VCDLVLFEHTHTHIADFLLTGAAVYAGMLAGEVEGFCRRIFIFTNAVARSEFVCVCVSSALSLDCL